VKLRLSAITVPVVGIYTVGSKKAQLPKRMLFLEPTAAESFSSHVAPLVVVSDMFRSPESSLSAVRSGRGAKPPGFSGHNFGLSFDIDVLPSIRRGGFADKRQLDIWLAGLGWFCHRRDHQITELRGESHHFNFLGPGVRLRTTSPAALEEKIIQLYGKELTLSPKELQAALAKMRFYGGAIDGKIGPLTKEATKAFQRAWGMRETGTADARVQRTLAYVSAER
jgi:hypothetical protein